METQHTIGYGGRQTTEECPEAIFIMSIQELEMLLNNIFPVIPITARPSV